MQLEAIQPAVQMAGVSRNTSVVIVSDVHLKAGAPDSESWCPLAIALREELQARPVFDEVEVTAGWVHVSFRHGSWHAPVTQELYEFIEQFDATADDEGEQDPGKLEALLAKASAGLLFPLTWHEGDPPGYDEDAFGCGAVPPVSELPPFSGLLARCPKCTAVIEAAEYQHAFRRAEPPGREPGSSLELSLAFEKAMERLEKQYAGRLGGAGEHMLRACPVCRFEWAERCADSGGSAGADRAGPESSAPPADSSDSGRKEGGEGG